MKRVLTVLAAALLAACSPHLGREGWGERPYEALQALVQADGVRGGYAVFDCDNTTVLHDVSHNLTIYMLENLLFRDARPTTLRTGFQIRTSSSRASRYPLRRPERALPKSFTPSGACWTGA